ncbi:MAG: peroxiredoxin [Agitococcus sp.]|nr:peroxiredoxin [Agitococcus sp.]
MPLTLGDTLPSLLVKATSGKTIDLVTLTGKNVVIYFYPKDATPGCTTEAQDFRDLMPEFAQLNCEIFGVSRDSLNSHEKFKANECLPFELLSDVDEALCQAFDVIKMKNMYGKNVMGVERSTFLFNAKGQLQQEWRKVKAQGHAAIVLAALKQL